MHPMSSLVTSVTLATLSSRSFCCALALALVSSPVLGQSGGAQKAPALPNIPTGVVTKITLADGELFLKTLGAPYKKVAGNVYAFEYEGVRMLVVNNQTDLQISAGFDTSEPISLTAINSWNTQMRYTKAYLDPEGVSVIVSDIDLRGGVTLGAVKEFVSTFFQSVRQFREFLENGGGEVPAGATIVQPDTSGN